jgi:ubiquinone/menaquinone biosynthesis C-methylase UbiE
VVDSALQLRVQRYGWDKAAAHYERFWAEQLRPAQNRLLDLADLRPGERVLDVACGTGLVTLRAAAAVGSRGSVVGTDISEAMVAALRKAAAGSGMPQVTAERMGAEDLRLADETFDVALCALGLMYVPDPVASLREIRRVVKPGGRAVVAVWGARKNCGWAEIFPIVDRRVRSEVCPMFFQLGTMNSLALAFAAAGFVNVTSDRLLTSLVYESAEDAIGAAFVGGPVALAYSRFDEPTREGAQVEYLASIESHRRGLGYAIPGEFVIARAQKAE